MENNNNKQSLMQKSTMTHTIAKSQETLDLAVAIVKGVQNVAFLEMNLTLKETIKQNQQLKKWHF